MGGQAHGQEAVLMVGIVIPVGSGLWERKRRQAGWRGKDEGNEEFGCGGCGVPNAAILPTRDASSFPGYLLLSQEGAILLGLLHLPRVWAKINNVLQ